MFWNRNKVVDNFEDQEGVHQYTAELRRIFGPGMASSPSEQIIDGVRPSIQRALRLMPGFATLGADIEAIEQHDRRNEDLIISGRRVPAGRRRTPAELQSDVRADIHFGAWMSQRRIEQLLTDPLNANIRNLLARRLGPDVFENLEDRPEIRHGIALAFEQGVGAVNILNFLNNALVGDGGGVQPFLNKDQAKRELDTAKTDLQTVEEYSTKIPEAVRPLTAEGGNLANNWDTLNGKINALRLIDAPSREQVNQLKEFTAEMKRLQEKRQKLQIECDKILEVANHLAIHYPPPGGIPGIPAANQPLPLLQNHLGPMPVPAPVPPPPIVDWSGSDLDSWESIQRTIVFLGTPEFADAMATIRPYLQHTVRERERAHKNAEKGFELSQDGLDDKISATEFNYRIWRQIYRIRAAVPPAVGAPLPQTAIDEDLIAKYAAFATMTSLGQARDQELIQIKNQIRAEEFYRRSGLFRRVFSMTHFSPSANQMLDRIRHITITKNEGQVTVKPFANLKLKTTASREDIRKAVAEGKLSAEDIPQLYIHLKGILKHYAKRSIKPQHLTYLVGLIESLKTIRNEMLHKELISQFQTAEGTPQQNMIKLLEAKINDEKAHEKRLSDDILTGQFLNTIKPKDIKRDKTGVLKEVKDKMNSGEWGYSDAVNYMKEKGFDPGLLRKTGLIGRKFKNWFKPRQEEEGRPGLIGRTANAGIGLAKAPFKLGWGLSWPARALISKFRLLSAPAQILNNLNIFSKKETKALWREKIKAMNEKFGTF